MSKKNQGAKEARVVEQGPGPEVVAEFKADGKGGGTLELSYRGPLVKLDRLWVRVGERRHGEDWLEVRDLRLEKRDNVASARIPIADGADPLEAASFAFFGMRDGKEEVWDSAGRPFGCYVLDLKTREVHPA